MPIAYGSRRIPFLCKNDRVSFRGGCAAPQHNSELIRKVKHIRLRDVCGRRSQGAAVMGSSGSPGLPVPASRELGELSCLQGFLSLEPL